MTYYDSKQAWYTYDAMNRVASATGLDGEVTAYAYDKAGRRILTQTGDPTSAGSLTTEYSYDSVATCWSKSPAVQAASVPLQLQQKRLYHGREARGGRKDH